MKRPESPINFLAAIIVAIIVGVVTFAATRQIVNTFIFAIITGGAIGAYGTVKKKLNQAQRIKKMELSFPDFLQLVASNLRAGITIDKSLIISSRKEFSPLDEEINQLGRDLVTGKQIGVAMKEMALRIKSEKLTKTINLIITGMKSGGDISTLLEQTATNMHERGYVEKRAASNVLMYVILIFFAAAVGAPALFGLSTVLVSVLKQILSNVPQTPSSISVPFVMTSVNISTTFITYFAITFLVMIDLLGSMVIGLVQKGEEREGLRFVIPMIALSVGIFLVIKIFLSSYFSGIIG